MAEDEDDLRERLAEVEQKHRDLDVILDKILHVQPIDFLQLTRLKKEKLSLKDQIQRIRSQLVPDIIA
ncbi:MAG: DUF465 domain-containing protein [Pseudomonadota bacterium]